jgi:cobalamin biosynthesis protein CobD/CbiB
LIRGGIVLAFVLWLVWLLHVGLGFAAKAFDNEEATKTIHFVVLCMSISPVAALLSVARYGRVATKSGKAEGHKTQKDNFFKRMAVSSGLNLVHLDDHGLSRTALRQIVVTLTTSCVAPILAFIVSGVFGLLLYCFLNAAFLSPGKSLAKNSFSKALAWFPKLFHVIAGFIVSIIFTIAMPFAASAKFSKALGGWNRPKKDGFGHTYDGGRALNIMAHGLGVTLGGSYQDENGQGVYAPWLGADGASSQIKPVDILRGVYLCAIALLFLSITLYGILILT